MSTALTQICGYCGRPVVTGVAIGPQLFHLECTRGPGFQPPSPNGPAIPLVPLLTEADVRRIVREELARANLVTDKSHDV